MNRLETIDNIKPKYNFIQLFYLYIFFIINVEFFLLFLFVKYPSKYFNFKIFSLLHDIDIKNLKDNIKKEREDKEALNQSTKQQQKFDKLDNGSEKLKSLYILYLLY